MGALGRSAPPNMATVLPPTLSNRKASPRDRELITYGVGRVSGEQVETEDGEDDHEEEQQQKDVHEWWQRLEDLPQVAGEKDGHA